jgi:two-component system, chemotaxis family, chemotaxis protein CheY
LKTALVVEDSAIMRGIIVSSLSNLQQQVRSVEVANGFEALRALPQEKFDIILTDINMPDINGLELLSFLKNHPHYRSIPVVIISTEKSESDRKRGLELGADDYLAKPFEPGELEKIIRRLLNI